MLLYSLGFHVICVVECFYSFIISCIPISCIFNIELARFGPYAAPYMAWNTFWYCIEEIIDSATANDAVLV